MVAEFRTILVRVDVGRIGHIVAGPLEPADELHLPDEELPVPAPGVRPIEGHFHRAPVAPYRVGPVAVVRVQALAVNSIIGIVVICLVGRDALLIEEGRRTSVAHHEVHVILIPRGIGQLHHVDTAGPVLGDGHRVARRPAAGDHSGGCVRNAWLLPGSVKWADVEAQTTSQASVPAHSINIHRIGLRRVDRYVKADGLVLADTRGGRVALDLAIGVIRRVEPRTLPSAGSGLLILGNDRVIGGLRAEIRNRTCGCQQAQS